MNYLISCFTLVFFCVRLIQIIIPPNELIDIIFKIFDIIYFVNGIVLYAVRIAIGPGNFNEKFQIR